MKYITCKTTHYTGEVFIDAMKIADNEEYVIVEADNVEQAKEKMKEAIICPNCESLDTYVEEIVESSTGWKLGEVLICNTCKGVKQKA